MRRNRKRKIINQIKQAKQIGGQRAIRILGFTFFHILKLIKADDKRSKVIQSLVLTPSFALRIFKVTKFEKFVIECVGSFIPDFIFEKSFKNGHNIIIVVNKGMIRNVAKTKIKRINIISNLLPRNIRIAELGDKVPVLSTIINEIALSNLTPYKINIPSLEVNFNLNEIEIDNIINHESRRV